ncbi:TerD family protein [Kineococcus rhizosphaerae]|uniref:Uncharacterized protein n=1 Tax=Kineococcus rhizosphaerae TaxID=559628 RepID=A0A2T0QNC1_9ACTN|nr:TerD family protein [Kineococcus rhizosphaerae]PRY06101.1 hypothetical protein CLV37_13516 [Kineococcus rhizosphaerae]
MVLNDGYFVFFNRLKSPEGSVDWKVRAVGQGSRSEFDLDRQAIPGSP